MPRYIPSLGYIRRITRDKHEHVGPVAVRRCHRALSLGGLDEMARGPALRLRWYANYKVIFVMNDLLEVV